MSNPTPFMKEAEGYLHGSGVPAAQNLVPHWQVFFAVTQKPLTFVVGNTTVPGRAKVAIERYTSTSGKRCERWMTPVHEETYLALLSAKLAVYTALVARNAEQSSKYKLPGLDLEQAQEMVRDALLASYERSGIAESYNDEPVPSRLEIVTRERAVDRMVGR